MTDPEQVSTTPKDTIAGLVHYSLNYGQFPLVEELEVFSESEEVVHREFLYLKLFAVHMSIQWAPWKEEQKLAVGQEFPSALAQVVPSTIPEEIIGGLTLQGFCDELSERFLQYEIAASTPHENGPGWQIGKKFSELSNRGDWEAVALASMPVLTVYTDLLEILAAQTSNLKIVEL